jgi:hypothetical protein
MLNQTYADSGIAHVRQIFRDLVLDVKYACSAVAGFTPLISSGESLHAPVRAGVEEARARAKSRHSALALSSTRTIS